MKSNKYIFISYAKEDYDWAERLYNDLKKEGLNPWLDEKNILPGQNWKLIIRNAIKESSHCIIMHSSHSLKKSGFVQKEIRMAIELYKEMPENTIYIIPVRIDECEPANEILTDIQRVDLFPDYNKGMERILLALSTGKTVTGTHVKPSIFPEHITVERISIGGERSGHLTISSDGEGVFFIHKITLSKGLEWFTFEKINYQEKHITKHSTFEFKYKIVTDSLDTGSFTGTVSIEIEGMENPINVPVKIETIAGPKLTIMEADEFNRNGRAVPILRESNVPKRQELTKGFYIKNDGDDTLDVTKIETNSPELKIYDKEVLDLLPSDDRKINFSINTDKCSKGVNNFSIFIHSNDELKNRLEIIYELDILGELEALDEYIGIDIGPTKTCVACINDGKPELIEHYGTERIPSALYFDGEGNNLREILYGIVAKRVMCICPENGIRSIITKLRSRSDRTFFGKTYSPTELASIFIKKIVEMTEDSLIEKGIFKSPKRAIFTVPVDFIDRERRELLHACRMAGVNENEMLPDGGTLIDRPNATALYYIYKKYVELKEKPKNETLVIYNFGKRMLEVSAIEIKIERRKAISITLHSSKENKQISGDQINKRIMYYIADNIKKEYPDFDERYIKYNEKEMTECYQGLGTDIYNKVIVNRNQLETTVENRKIQLSSMYINSSYYEIYCLIDKNKLIARKDDIYFRDEKTGDLIDFKGEIKSDDLIMIIEGLVTESLLQIEQTLTLADMKKENVNAVILTGATTSIPYIKKTIKDYFGKGTAFYDDKVIPNKIHTALGAAFYGYTRSYPGVNIQLQSKLRDENG